MMRRLFNPVIGRVARQTGATNKDVARVLKLIIDMQRTYANEPPLVIMETILQCAAALKLPAGRAEAIVNALFAEGLAAAKGPR